MSAAYAFLPWLRRGMATAVVAAPGAPRAQAEVSVSVNAGALEAATKLALIGPRDVIGLDRRAVQRVWPRPDAYDAAASYFPLLEVSQPDLPWRYSPAAPDAQGRLRPWLCLAALKFDEFERAGQAGAERPLAVIEVATAASLPKLAESWAWAHVQVSGATSVTAREAATLLKDGPQRLLARLLCPRRLEPRTRYTGFLVPAFEGGVRAGLGDTPPSDLDALTAAWSDASASLSLPVYYEWEFQTGEAQDFEALVGRLRKGAVDPRSGKRPMDVSAPGLGRRAAAGRPLGAESALRVPLVDASEERAAELAAWTLDERRAWVLALKRVADAPGPEPLRNRWEPVSQIVGHPVEADLDCSNEDRAAVFGAAGDFDGDGARELAFGIEGTAELWVMQLDRAAAVWRHLSPRQGGIGDVECSQVFGLGAGAAAAGDFDGDGVDELAVLPGEPGSGVFVDGCWIMKYDAATRAWNHFGRGAGPPWLDFQCGDGSVSARFLVAGDFDGDGVDELAIAANENAFWVMKLEVTGSSWFHLGPESLGSARADVLCSSLGVPARLAVAADVDHDGADELVVSAEGGAAFWVMCWDAPTGRWTHLTSDSGPLEADFTTNDVGTPARFAVAGDFDGDGKDEIAVGPARTGSDGNDLWVLSFDRIGRTWGHLGTIPAHPRQADIDCSTVDVAADFAVAGDFTGDRQTQLAVAAQGTNAFWVMRYDRSARAWQHVSPIRGHPAEADLDVTALDVAALYAIAADVDEDGREELTVAPTATGSAGNDLWVRRIAPRVAGPASLGPPLYGRWHAGRDSLGPSREPWPWFDALNADPRHRVAAGLGVQVIQERQEELMASAWTQVEGIRAANEELRQAQLAREAARRMHARHLAVEDPEVILPLCAPVHGRVLDPDGGLTVSGRLERTAIVPGALAAQWRRVARPLGAVGRRQRRFADPKPSTLLTRLNRRQLRPAAPPAPPAGAALRSRLGLPAGVSVTDLQNGPQRPSFVARDYPPDDPDGFPRMVARPGDADTGPDNPASGDFRTAVVACWSRLDPAPPALAAPAPVDLEVRRKAVVAALDPEKTFADAYKGRVSVDDFHPEDPLEPVQVGPQFPQPMMEPLRQISQDWLFSGLDRVPPDSLSVLEINRRFVHAYMVGLNFEMARELLYREYPINGQRGTYFRQFWDPASFLPRPGETLHRARLADIDPIVEWPDEAALDAAGKHDALAGNPLVLLLRGDLLARYPTMLLYAVAAKRIQGGDLTEPANRGPDFAREEHPFLRGRLEPDVSFFGFRLTRDQVLASASDGGWYFVLQEQPSEARFGLDADSRDPTDPTPFGWDDLSWPDLTPAIAPGAHINLATTKPATTPAPSANPNGARWDGGAADLAFITLQRQVRLVVHASDLILPDATA